MMLFHVNWLAAVVATIVSMAAGFGWYMAFGKPWMAALGKTREQMMANGRSPMPFIRSGIGQLVIAAFLNILTPRLFGSTTVFFGVLTGVHMWAGFIITSMVINHRFQGQKWLLTLIDGGYLLVVMILQGAVIGLFG